MAVSDKTEKPTSKRRHTKPDEEKNVRELIRQVAELNNVTPDQVAHIFLTEFRFVKAVIEKGDLEGVSLPNFGKFFVKPGKLYFVDKKTNGTWMPKRTIIEEFMPKRKKGFKREDYEREVEEHNRRMEELRLERRESRKASLAKSRDMQQVPTDRPNGEEV